MSAESERPKLLVIDDELAILKLARALLTRAGYEVTTASSGTDGLRLLDETPFACIITDAIMPVMTGYDLVRAIRNHPQHGETPVLMLTRKRNREDVKEAVEVGVTDYVLKPIDEQLLLDKVEFCIMKGKGRRHVFELSMDGGEESLAIAKLPSRISSVSETSITLHVPIALTNNSDCTFDFPVFRQNGIDMPLLKLVSCQPVTNQQDPKHLPFEVKFAFIGMQESELQKIRAWIQRESVKRRK